MWYTHAMNPEIINHIYGTVGLPTLDNVTLSEIKFVTGGDLEVRLVFLDVAFPLNPSAKWVEQKYNSVSLHITLIGVTDVVLRCKNFAGKVSAKIVRNSIADVNGFFFIARGMGGTELKLFFQWLHIGGLSGYTQDMMEG